MNIEDIEGIGSAYAVRLKAAGITTVEALLEQGGAAKGRGAIASSTGISEKLILTWVNHADLIRLNGVGPQYAELLEAAGVDTVKELRTRNAANLTTRLIEINEAKNISGTTPSEKQVTAWIEEAKTLDPKVSH
jgi:predicted flap endonuclease-1-like 5' DNA nuclease